MGKAPTMDEIIPLISSDTVGPLGIKHLPRLWLKTLLSAKGRLPDGYKDIRPGFDYLVLEGLRVDPDSARDFIRQELPTYPVFERWIVRQPGVDVSAENILKINERLAAKTKTAEARRQILRENGLPEDTPIEDGIMLNNLDDWRAMHGQLAELKK